jgi:hypothetical protein
LTLIFNINLGRIIKKENYKLLESELIRSKGYRKLKKKPYDKTCVGKNFVRNKIHHFLKLIKFWIIFVCSDTLNFRVSIDGWAKKFTLILIDKNQYIKKYSYLIWI